MLCEVEKSRRWIVGRYKVAIPWKEEFPFLPDNREAEKRLVSFRHVQYSQLDSGGQNLEFDGI